MVTALALSAGCGDNDNNDNNGNDNQNPQPTRTTTPGPVATQTPAPQATATPTTGTTASASFEITATTGLQGFDIRVAYPTGKGSFAGEGENVECTTTATANFVKNDQENGTLVLIVASTSNLTFPINITCTFAENAGQSLASGDLTATVREVTANGAPGDTSTLQVGVNVS
jgi:hypothetical protein